MIKKEYFNYINIEHICTITQLCICTNYFICIEGKEEEEEDVLPLLLLLKYFI